MPFVRAIKTKHVDPVTGVVLWTTVGLATIDPYRAADMAGEANALIDELLVDRKRIRQTQRDADALCRDLQRDLEAVDQEIKHYNDRLELAGRPRREIPEE